MPHALFVDSTLSEISSAVQIAERYGFTVYTARSLKDLSSLSEHFLPDVAFINQDLPDGSGFDLLAQNPWGAATRFFILMQTIELEAALKSFRLKATDIIQKPINLTRFEELISRCIQERGIYQRPVKQEMSDSKFGRLVGQSEPMQKLYRMIERVAPTNATVLIHGESGTGKELVAQTLHDYSQRSHKPFIAINCGAISTDLISSALFGHEKGSFTGAQQAHKGYFEQATNGTLFLDEITETNFELQVKLLRVLETHTVIPVGGKRQLVTNTRVIAATNRIPEDAVMAGTLREDLYYRLNTFPLAVPPLRERGNDITLLSQFFLEQLNLEHNLDTTIDIPALELLQAWSWPGNVRELKNVIHRAFILADNRIQAKHICFGHSLNQYNDYLKLIIKIGTPLAAVEQQFISKTWQHCDRNTKLAIKLLNVDQKFLNKYLKQNIANQQDQK